MARDPSRTESTRATAGVRELLTDGCWTLAASDDPAEIAYLVLEAA